MGSAATIKSTLRGALGFTNLSDAAGYAIAAQAVGDFLDNVLQELTNTQNSILSIINTQRYGRSGYYTSVALAFQDGDDLVPAVGTLDPSYAVIDPTKQIVKQAAFQNNAGSLSLKVAAQNSVTGLLIPLTAQQYADLSAYYVSFEIPGIPITIVSLPGNVFSFSVVCTFNSGYNQSNLAANIATQLLLFATTFPFNGLLYSDQLSDFIKANVPGVIDFYISGTLIDGQSFAGSTSLTAGYFNYAAGYLNAITYNSVSQ